MPLVHRFPTGKLPPVQGMPFNRLCVAVLFCCWRLVPTGFGGEPKHDDVQVAKTAERFLAVLERNPRKGVPLDKVVAFHLARSTVPSLIERYRRRTESNANDGVAWMLLGLLESQQNNDRAAIDAYRRAESSLPTNPLPSLYLGQSLSLAGKLESAVEAFERAIDRHPSRADLLEAYLSLTLAHRSMGNAAKELETLARLDRLFPDDLQVQEQIANSLADAGRVAMALEKIQRLAAIAKDPYRQSVYRLESARMRMELGQSKEALEGLEQLLAQLNPESWLYRDVRQKIEEVFLRSRDRAGLVAYYERWLALHSDDVDAMAALARDLALVGQAAKARPWLEKGIKAAPSRKDLRLALIAQLVREKKVNQAIAEYEALDRLDPNNPETLRDWGNLILKTPPASSHESGAESARRETVKAIWMRLADSKPNDPAIALRAAELFRSAGFENEATALYRQASRLAPESAEYHEYLGEYLHTLKRPGDAIQEWKKIAEAPRRNPESLSRLAEILTRFGYADESVAAMKEAIAIEPREFALRFKLAQVLARAHRLEEAAMEFRHTRELSTSPTEGDAALTEELQCLAENGGLRDRIDSLQNTSHRDRGPDEWYLLARHFEAASEIPRALEAIRLCVQSGRHSSLTLGAAARIHESAGKLAEAVDWNRKLAAMDRRYRAEALAAVARLEAKLGHRDSALRAGREMLTAAGGAAEHRIAFAELCFSLAAIDEGLQSLRSLVRIDPRDIRAVRILADALRKQSRTNEAIAAYWRLFELAVDPEEKLGAVSNLSILSARCGRFHELIHRLQRERSSAEDPQWFTRCLSRAYEANDDFIAASKTLEQLLVGDERDLEWIRKLVTLSVTRQAWEAAVEYQRRIVDLTRSSTEKLRLAELYERAGDISASATVLNELVRDETDLAVILQAVDALENSGRHEDAVAAIRKLGAHYPERWEVRFRLAALDANPSETPRLFQTLSRLDVPEARAPAAVSNTGSGPASVQNPVLTRLQFCQNYSTRAQRFVAPVDAEEARIESAIRLYQLAEARGAGSELLKWRDAAEAVPPDAHARWDWFYVRLSKKDAFGAGKLLSDLDQPAAKWAFLYSLQFRDAAIGRGPLPDLEVDRILDACRYLLVHRPEWITREPASPRSVIGAVRSELAMAARLQELQRMLATRAPSSR